MDKLITAEEYNKMSWFDAQAVYWRELLIHGDDAIEPPNRFIIPSVYVYDAKTLQALLPEDDEEDG